MRLKLFFTLIICIFLMTSCTLSLTFQNVSTHGVADDVVDSTPTSETKVETDVTVPANALL